MWNLLAFLLNLPWTVLGLIAALLGVPSKISLYKEPFALVCTVRSLWFLRLQTKYPRGMALGNVVLLGPHVQDRDLEHELVHVAQFIREPLIHPVLNTIETIRFGYRRNKYEAEAYDTTDSVYSGGVWTGCIVAESLNDLSILSHLTVSKMRETDNMNPQDRWHIYHVQDVTRDQIEILTTLIKDRWYCHFWREGDFIVVYRNRLFVFKATNQYGRKLAVEYGMKLGIAEEQLDFVVE